MCVCVCVAYSPSIIHSITFDIAEFVKDRAEHQSTELPYIVKAVGDESAAGEDDVVVYTNFRKWTTAMWYVHLARANRVVLYSYPLFV